jgi:hypothetical protein
VARVTVEAKPLEKARDYGIKSGSKKSEPLRSRTTASQTIGKARNNFTFHDKEHTIMHDTSMHKRSLKGTYEPEK